MKAPDGGFGIDQITKQEARGVSSQETFMNNTVLSIIKHSPAVRALAAAGALALSLSTGLAAGGEVLPPTAPQYGFSYQEWSAQWWQWTLSRSTNQTADVGLPVCECSGPPHLVRFLAGAPGSITAKRRITINDKVALFFPILSVWVDNTGCPDFTANTAAQLLSEAEGNWSAVTQTSCEIDGAPVAGLSDPQNTEYLVEAPPFSYTTAAKHNVLANVYGAPCMDGNTAIYPAVADGVYLMVSPFKPGKHTIHLTGVVGPASSPFLDEDLTYEITVVRE